MSEIKLEQNPRVWEIAERFAHLVNVMFTLRSERGCPWDRAQTLKDLRQYLLEESYEVLHALDTDDAVGLREELGDLLLQVVFLAQVMQEQSKFTLAEVIDALNSKMVGRHPHVFEGVEAGSPEQALNNWESRKSQEKAAAGGSDRSILQGLPLSLPALLQAHLISAKVARVGFDWEKEQDVWDKLREEVKEFCNARSPEEKEEEMGDILFTIVNLARKNKINAEDALRAANLKFKQRFEQLEKKVYSQNKDFTDLNLQEMDDIWNSVKKDLINGKEQDKS